MEAGYPMMPALTRQVIGNLSSADRKLLDEVLTNAGFSYDDVAAKPNIEELSDLVIAHATNSGMADHRALEDHIKELIVGELLKVKNPDLSNHVRFLEGLRRRAFGRNCCVWIITTNYDLLFEAAAAQARVPLINGFCGVTTRFFDTALYDHVIGTVSKGRFVHVPQLTVKLIKLHGSLSWFANSDGVFEMHPDAINHSIVRTMVLPRRKKVIDTLAYPFDQIFGRARRSIGFECRYLVSCGFSFGDDHINQNIILPQLAAGRCRLVALCKEEPPGIAGFRGLPTFSAGFNDRSIAQGKDSAEATDLWSFSKFAGAFG